MKILGKEWSYAKCLDVAKNSNETYFLDALLEHPDDRVVVALASRDLPWLVAMITPIYPVAVLSAVAKNPITAPETLLVLRQEQIISVRAAVASNPNIFIYFVSVFGAPGKSIGANMWRDKSAVVRRSLASNPNIGLDQVAARSLSEDMNDTVRLRIAANPLAPADVLAQLAEDYEFDVRRAVANNPGSPLWVTEMLGEEFPPVVAGARRLHR